MKTILLISLPVFDVVKLFEDEADRTFNLFYIFRLLVRIDLPFGERFMGLGWGQSRRESCDDAINSSYRQDLISKLR